MSLTFVSARGQLGTLDGETVGVMVIDAPDGALSGDMEFVSHLAEWEVDGEGYERATVDLAYGIEDSVGVVRYDDAPASFDTTGSTPTHAVFFLPAASDAERALLFALSVEQGEGFDGWEVGEDAELGLARVTERVEDLTFQFPLVRVENMVSFAGESGGDGGGLVGATIVEVVDGVADVAAAIESGSVTAMILSDDQGDTFTAPDLETTSPWWLVVASSAWPEDPTGTPIDFPDEVLSGFGWFDLSGGEEVAFFLWEMVPFRNNDDSQVWRAVPQISTAALEGMGGGGGPDLSDATPQALGVAGAGTSPDAARADHVHAMPTAADVGAAPSTSTPWRDAVALPCYQYPNSGAGSLTFTAGAFVAGGYYTTPNTNDASLTYSRLPLRAGTWAVDVYWRGAGSSGIATLTLGGTGIGTVDTYSAGTTNNNRTSLTGVTVATDGFYDLVITNPTKNGSSSNFTLQIHAIVLRRTGA